MPQLTIDVTLAQAQRIAAAFGQHFGTRDENGEIRNATMPEVKQILISEIRKIVLYQESEAAKAAVATPPELGDIA